MLQLNIYGLIRIRYCLSACLQKYKFNSLYLYFFIKENKSLIKHFIRWIQKKF
jgi:hypothetical protein